MMNARRWRKRWAVVSVVLAGALPVAPRAATWRVTYDPAQPEDRVGSVAALAASGDTILIDPGTYYEHILLEGKSLTFIGTEGAASTILDGSRAFADRAGSIIYTMTGAAADLVLRGLTLRNGTGAPWTGSFNTIGGGAVFWWVDWRKPTAATLVVADCVFEANTTGGPDNLWAAGGGAIFAYDLNDARIERCLFAGNVSHTKGGDILSTSARTMVAQCHFRMEDVSANGGTSIDDESGRLTIRECSFESEAGGGSGFGYSISAQPIRTEITDSQFIDRGSPLATRIHLYFFGVGDPLQEVLVSRNVFWSASGPDSAGPTSLEIAMPNGALNISENTFVRCGVHVDNGGGAPPMVFERNIIVRGKVRFFVPSGGSLKCNDFWRTPVTDPYGTLVFTDNISEPPLLCNEPAGDLEIARASPCAAENSPAGCGRIGALDPACDVSPVRQMSWGRLKARFR